MRELNSIISVWDGVGCVYGQMPVTVKSQEALTVRISVSSGASITMKRGRRTISTVTMDIAPIVATLMKYSMPTLDSSSDSKMVDGVSLYIEGETENFLNQTLISQVVFGSASMPQSRSVMYYSNLPCTIDVTQPNYTVDDYLYIALPGSDVTNLNTYTQIDTGNAYMVTNYLGNILVGSNGFIRVVRALGTETAEQTLALPELLVKNSECTEGIYLRWLAYTGEVFYYLFKELGREYASEVSGSVIAKPTYVLDDTKSYSAGAVPTSYTNQTVVSIGARLERDLFETVRTILGSPIVEWWDGEKFNRVAVSDGSIADDGKDSQEVKLSITLPPTTTQQL